MRRFIVLIAALGVAVAGSAFPHRKAPVSVTFETKAGRVTFTHASHIKCEKKNCGACHDKLAPQSAVTPIKSSAACGPCHHEGGRAFEMKGHCARCHATEAKPGAVS